MCQNYRGEISKNVRLPILIISVTCTSKLNHREEPEGKDDKMQILSDENVFEPFRRRKMGV